MRTKSKRSIIDAFKASFGIDPEVLYPDIQAFYSNLRQSGDLVQKRQIMFREYVMFATALFAQSLSEDQYIEVLLDRMHRNLGLSRADYYQLERGKLRLIAKIGLTQMEIGQERELGLPTHMIGPDRLNHQGFTNDPWQYDFLVIITNRKNRVIRVIGFDRLEQQIDANELLILRYFARILDYLVSKKIFEDQIKNLDPMTLYFSKGFMLRQEPGYFRDVQVQALVDFDNFKPINTKYGYKGGDEVIEFVCDFIEDRIRNADLCRWGGEEFWIGFHDCSLEDARRRLQEIMDELSKVVVPKLNIQVSFSVGLGMYDHNLPIKENIDLLNPLLQRAKDTGKAKIIVL